MSISNSPDHHTETMPPLALGRAEAAKTLGIGKRKLSELTADRSSGIPYFRIGRRVLYPYAGLQQWLADQISNG